MPKNENHLLGSNKTLSSEKKKITLFFCDVYGTIDGGFTNFDCYNFAKLLERIKEQNNSDYLFFSMLSSEVPQVVTSYGEQLSKYFDNNVLLIPNFEEADDLRQVKVSCALYRVELLKKKYNINSVFLADDMSLLHEMLGEILNEIEGIPLNSIIPSKGENKLSFINDILTRKISEEEIKKNYRKKIY